LTLPETHGTLIRTAEGLLDLVRHLRASGSFALDTEFIREKTYRPQLCLVQLATPERAALIDPYLLPDLGPLLELILDPAVEKVLHAGEQDMEIFFAMGRGVPARVWDTQVAAALAGRGESISYARLVDELCGVRLSKVETFTDWSRRPLSNEQLEYALDDVKYLLEAKGKLLAELESLGRRDWLEAELRFYEDRELYEKDPAKLYLRVRSAAKLDRQELAVLRELAAWREEEAQRQDWPRGRILLDEALVELARRAPRQVEDIGRVRGIHPQLVRRAGAELVRRVERARALPAAAWPPAIERRAADDELSLVVDALELVLRSRAAASRIAPAYLASRRDLEELARSSLGGGDPGAARERPLPILTGWRRELAGAALLELLAGKSSIAIDRARTRVEVVER